MDGQDELQLADAQPSSASALSGLSGLSGSSAYVSLPSEEHPPRYTRDTPLEVLRTKNLLFNHHK